MRRFVIATTLIFCMLLVSHASAAVPRAFYGVIAANDPDSSEIARMGTGKVGTLRINFVWGAVQPSEGSSYQWGHYDAIIGAAAQQGIRVLPTVYSSPSWAANKTNYPPDKAHTAAFGAFVQAAAARYGANGSFWSENPSIPRTPVTDWQLWNEVNSPSFWYSKPSVEAVRRPAAGVPRRDQGRRPRRRTSSSRGSSGRRRSSTGSTSTATCPGSTGARRRGCSTPSPSIRTRRRRATPSMPSRRRARS